MCCNVQKNKNKKQTQLFKIHKNCILKNKNMKQNNKTLKINYFLIIKNYYKNENVHQIYMKRPY